MPQNACLLFKKIWTAFKNSLLQPLFLSGIHGNATLHYFIFWQHIYLDFVPICCFFLQLQKLVVLDRIFFEAFFLIPCHETKDDFIRFKLLSTHFLWRCLTAAKVLVWLLGRISKLRLDPNPEQNQNPARLSEKSQRYDSKDTDLSIYHCNVSRGTFLPNL